MHETVKKEKALLVLAQEQKEPWSREDLAAEFQALVSSTGIEIEKLVSFNLHQPNPRLYIGKGKVQELLAIVNETGISVVIFNNNLHVSQQRNLEDIFGVKTIDRTQLILDIFAKHAQTQEGILQVELAQLEYLMPRLRGKGIMLSRLGGGIGTSGPGEKKLEIDRRRIAERIYHLKEELDKVRQHRMVIRKKREKNKTAVCSLVGYTNAGKTTLFNFLTQDSQTTSLTLFTTLDTVSRSFTLFDKTPVILSDTVGFIYKLPPYLVESFKATLEELHHSDVLLHLIDSSSKNILQIKKAVDQTLKELDLESKPTITVFNKIDMVPEDTLKNLRQEYPEAVFISAAQGSNILDLKKIIYEKINRGYFEGILRLPFNRMDIINYLHKNCEILKVTYQKEEAVYWIRTKPENINYLKKQGLTIKEIT